MQTGKTETYTTKSAHGPDNYPPALQTVTIFTIRKEDRKVIAESTVIRARSGRH